MTMYEIKVGNLYLAGKFDAQEAARIMARIQPCVNDPIEIRPATEEEPELKVIDGGRLT